MRSFGHDKGGRETASGNPAKACQARAASAERTRIAARRSRLDHDKVQGRTEDTLLHGLLARGAWAEHMEEEVQT